MLILRNQARIVLTKARYILGFTILIGIHFNCIIFFATELEISELFRTEHVTAELVITEFVVVTRLVINHVLGI